MYGNTNMEFVGLVKLHIFLDQMTGTTFKPSVFMYGLKPLYCRATLIIKFNVVK